VIKRAAVALGLFLALLSATPLLAHPGSAIVVDRLGQVWFLDTGDGLWKIDTRGALIRMRGDRFHWMALDQADRFVNAFLPSQVARVGRSPTMLIASDYPVAVGTDGNMYYPSAVTGGRLEIMRVRPTGAATPLATLPATTLTQSPLRWVNGLAGGADGSLYFTEDKSIRRITMRGQVETVVADVRPTGCVHIPGNDASAGPFLRGLAVDASGVIYVAASGCGSVLRITHGGEITKLVQLDAPWSPTAVALHGTDVYVLEYLHTEVEDRLAWIPRVRKVSADGRSAMIASVRRDPER
jgi:sugar lactone lactonase YvrE